MTVANSDAEHVELLRLAAEYAPYHKFPLFWEGVEDYGTVWERDYRGLDAQAWARGQECASRFERWRRARVNPPGWQEVDGVKLPPITWAEG